VIEQANQGSDGGHVPDLQSMTVHNRFDFTDLSECKVSWRSLSSSDHDHALDFQNASSLGTSSAEGGVGHASGAPHSRGHKLTLVGLTAATKRVEINVTSPRGFLLNTYEKTAFLRHLHIKTNILPRQARDKHRENSKKMPFSQVAPRIHTTGSGRVARG
jgi:hypothetical protein